MTQQTRTPKAPSAWNNRIYPIFFFPEQKRFYDNLEDLSRDAVAHMATKEATRNWSEHEKLSLLAVAYPANSAEGTHPLCAPNYPGLTPVFKRPSTITLFLLHPRIQGVKNATNIPYGLAKMQAVEQFQVSVYFHTCDAPEFLYYYNSAISDEDRQYTYVTTIPPHGLLIPVPNAMYLCYHLCSDRAPYGIDTDPAMYAGLKLPVVVRIPYAEAFNRTLPPDIDVRPINPRNY